MHFHSRKMHLKMSSGKWRPFCLGLNVLRWRLPASLIGNFYWLLGLYGAIHFCTPIRNKINCATTFVNVHVLTTLYMSYTKVNVIKINTDVKFERNHCKCIFADTRGILSLIRNWTVSSKWKPKMCIISSGHCTFVIYWYYMPQWFAQ